MKGESRNRERRPICSTTQNQRDENDHKWYQSHNMYIYYINIINILLYIYINSITEYCMYY